METFQIIWVCLTIFIILWVWEDAKKSGMSEGGWCLLTFLFGPVALAVYLIVRHDRGVKK